MQAKSRIQLIRENLHIKENLNDSLSSMMDRYNIQDSIFVMDMNMNVREVLEGYFVKSNEYDCLNDATYNTDNFVIRVIENNRFQTGSVYRTLAECPSGSEIYDIYSGKTLNI